MFYKYVKGIKKWRSSIPTLIRSDQRNRIMQLAHRHSFNPPALIILTKCHTYLAYPAPNTKCILTTHTYTYTRAANTLLPSVSFLSKAPIHERSPQPLPQLSMYTSHPRTHIRVRGIIHTESNGGKYATTAREEEKSKRGACARSRDDDERASERTTSSPLDGRRETAAGRQKAAAAAARASLSSLPFRGARARPSANGTRREREREREKERRVRWLFSRAAPFPSFLPRARYIGIGTCV